MLNRIIATLLLLPFIAFGQRPVMQAIYYDTTGIPYKIEQKYIHGDTSFYITHDNSYSFSIERSDTQHLDTSILVLAYRTIYTHPTSLDRLRGSDDLSFSSHDSDTTWVTGYATDIVSGSMQHVADTILTGEASREAYLFTERLKLARVPAIVAGPPVLIDSVGFVESVVAYCVHGLPVRVEHYDRPGRLQGVIIGQMGRRGAIYRRYFTDDTLEDYYQADTVRWTRKHDYLYWSSDRFAWHSISRRSAQIQGLSEIVSADDGKQTELHYLAGTDIFMHDFLGYILFDDTPFHTELYYFDHARLSTVSTGISYHYTYDAKHRITMKEKYSNSIRTGWTSYTYTD